MTSASLKNITMHQNGYNVDCDAGVKIMIQEGVKKVIQLKFRATNPPTSKQIFSRGTGPPPSPNPKTLSERKNLHRKEKLKRMPREDLRDR